MIAVKPADASELDVVSLGEVMLRLDPGEGRVRDAHRFDAHVGGGEYNVAHAASACFELRSAIATALVQNEVGALMRNRIRAAGVGTELIAWRRSDGVGTVRNGLNFTERGHGQRGALGEYDRAHTAAAGFGPGDVDWEDLFGRRGVRWFHTGGVFSVLSPGTAELALDAVTAANRHGTIVSFDVNHRPSLWRRFRERGGETSVIEAILERTDVLFAGAHDLSRMLGTATVDEAPTASGFRSMIETFRGRLPRLAVAATPVRTVHSASRNGWGGVAWSRAGGFAESRTGVEVEILDRVGGGDGFAAGFIFGALSGADLDRALALGIAHGALVMSTPGDTSSASLEEVVDLAGGAAPAARR